MEWIKISSPKIPTIINNERYLHRLNTTVGCVMTDPRKISINDFTYFLPPEKIASHPLEERDASRLLIYKQGKIEESKYKNIADYLPEQSLLVFNNTKVIEARLVFQKPSGGFIEIFCLEPHERYGGIGQALLQQERVLWQCFIGGASKWKHGQVLEKKIRSGNEEIILTATYTEKRSDSFIIELAWRPGSLNFGEVLHLAGAIPLPPYIKRPPELSDKQRYQTIYADFEGSVAAPTAGLHFTPGIFDSLKSRNIESCFVTLHVGAATFKPVKVSTLEDHEMHAEYIDVSRQTIQKILENTDGVIITAGTTSLRTVESLYWLGVKLIREVHQPASAPAELTQWYAYDNANNNISTRSSLQSLLQWMDQNRLERLQAKTQIIIVPGYKPRIAKALITNFHQPQSTLLLLVAAVIGQDWKKVYEYALQNGFRFLSYGDGSLLWFNEG